MIHGLAPGRNFCVLLRAEWFGMECVWGLTKADAGQDFMKLYGGCGTKLPGNSWEGWRRFGKSWTLGRTGVEGEGKLLSSQTPLTPNMLLPSWTGTHCFLHAPLCFHRTPLPSDAANFQPHPIPIWHPCCKLPVQSSLPQKLLHIMNHTLP